MGFDFTKIIAEETQKQQEIEQNSSGGNGFKTVYPFNNGRLEMRFLGNEASGLLYRELTFHTYYKDNKKQTVPCLKHMYGMECPICNAVNKVQEILNDQKVFGTYGIKKRGIMFAKLAGYTPDNYFADNQNPPKIGETVLFMFPKSAMNALRTTIIEYQDEIENIFASNTARTVSLRISTGANGFPEYSFHVKGNQTPIIINDETGYADDAAFSEFMANLPDLREIKYPMQPDENIYKVHRAIAEEIDMKYFGSPSNRPVEPAARVSDSIPQTTTVPQAPVQVASPTPVAPPPIQPNVAPSPTPPVVESTPATPTIQSNDSTNVEGLPFNLNESAPAPQVENIAPANDNTPPPCYGNNEYNDKCRACPWDSTCI